MAGRSSILCGRNIRAPSLLTPPRRHQLEPPSAVGGNGEESLTRGPRYPPGRSAPGLERPEKGNRMKRLVVIGAGYAGSCVARMFRDQFDVLVLEGDSMPGGLCKSYYRDGLVYEYGPHILANHNCSEEAIAFLRSHVDTVDTKVTSASFVRDRTTWYPVHRRNAALLGLEAEVEAELRGLPAAPRMDNFETYLVDRVGRTLYEIYFADFTRKFWGVDPASLSADWARTRHLGESLDAEEMFFNRSWCAYPRGDWNDLFRNLGVRTGWDL